MEDRSPSDILSFLQNVFAEIKAEDTLKVYYYSSLPFGASCLLMNCPLRYFILPFLNGSKMKAILLKILTARWGSCISEALNDSRRQV